MVAHLALQNLNVLASSKVFKYDVTASSRINYARSSFSSSANESIHVCSVWGNRVCEGHSETDGWEQGCIACCATTTTHLYASSHSMSLRTYCLYFFVMMMMMMMMYVCTPLML